jgi:hypothetical protein
VGSQLGASRWPVWMTAALVAWSRAAMARRTASRMRGVGWRAGPMPGRRGGLAVVAGGGQTQERRWVRLVGGGLG